jgi:hypothetical protein
VSGQQSLDQEWKQWELKKGLEQVQHWELEKGLEQVIGKVRWMRSQSLMALGKVLPL